MTLLTLIVLLGAPPPQAPAPAPLPPPPAPPRFLGPAKGGSYDERARSYRAIEHEVDRGAGRIVDPQTFQLDQFDRLSRLRANPFDADLRREYFYAEMDRTYRIDAKQIAEARHRKRTDAQRREAEMNLKEYELFINDSAGGSAIADQAERDRLALQQARTARDAEIDAARGSDNFEQIKRKAEERYQRERARILGFDPES